ncbi:MAG TPA: STAS domain-containing protein [Anaeromyxobacteraceae bacterium]|nr:STAS domain-containing protein [Anaeromyxobacteraceae bacterium]
MHDRASAGDPFVIRMDGTFDVVAARQVARELANAVGGPVQIDLTGVRNFDDSGVAVLADALTARGERVDVRGLRQHQRRLLRYLGIPSDEPAEGSDSAFADARG